MKFFCPFFNLASLFYTQNSHEMLTHCNFYLSMHKKLAILSILSKRKKIEDKDGNQNKRVFIDF